MIKVGIIDSGEPPAGELIRMVLAHPDTELVWVSRPELAGRRLRDVYANLWGAEALEFEGSFFEEGLVDAGYFEFSPG